MPGRSIQRRRPAHGFTLIELLVVVSILALLVAILLPGMRKARQQAKRLKCQTQLHQIAQAWHAYLNEYDGRFLQGANFNINYGGRQGDGSSVYQVAKPLNRFVKLADVTREGADLFRCPADRGSSAVRPTYFDYYGTSYMTNVMLIGQDQLNINPWADPCKDLKYEINKRLRNLNISRVASDPKLILIGDAGWVKTWEYAVTEKADWHGRPAWHNLAFLDGHVSFVRVRKGLHVTVDYTVIPFGDLQPEACDCQQEVGG